MVKQEWQQQSFLAPVHVDAGQKLPGRRWRKKRNPNPDVAAALAFRRQKRAAIYSDGQEPDFNQLTLQQQRVYQAIVQADKLKIENWREQYEAEKEGLTSQIFYLDQFVSLEERCGHCTEFIQRVAVVQKPGRGKHASQTQLLVNDYCPSCAHVDRLKKVWVPNGQVVRKE